MPSPVPPVRATRHYQPQFGVVYAYYPELRRLAQNAGHHNTIDAHFSTLTLPRESGTDRILATLKNAPRNASQRRIDALTIRELQRYGVKQITRPSFTALKGWVKDLLSWVLEPPREYGSLARPHTPAVHF
jgi:hypothetical protein